MVKGNMFSPWTRELSMRIHSELFSVNICAISTEIQQIEINLNISFAHSRFVIWVSFYHFTSDARMHADNFVQGIARLVYTAQCNQKFGVI